MGKSRLFVCVYISHGLPPALPGFCQVWPLFATAAGPAAADVVQRLTKKYIKVVQTTRGICFKCWSLLLPANYRVPDKITPKNLCSTVSNKGRRGHPLRVAKYSFGVRQWSGPSLLDKWQMKHTEPTQRAWNFSGNFNENLAVILRHSFSWRHFKKELGHNRRRRELKREKNVPAKLSLVSFQIEKKSLDSAHI